MPTEPRIRGATKAGFAVLLAGVALTAGGCGGNDQPAVCDSLENLSSDVSALRDIDLKAGEGTVAEIEASLETIKTDLQSVKTDAGEELSQPISGLESSLKTLTSEFDATKSDGDLTGTEAQGLLDSLAAVSASWETLKSEAPDCNL